MPHQPLPADGRVVVLGAGQAGFQLAASLREEGFGGSILLVGEEPGLPYQRPPLSKAYLLGKAREEDVTLRPARYFADHRLELLRGVRAVRIDRAARRVALSDGAAVEYDHLVLATGACNRALRVEGAALDGVVQLRDLREAEDIRQRLGAARRAVVVGAGFIGLEFAAVASSLGIAVTVLEALDRVMARAVSPETAGFFRAAHERNGVRFEFGAAAARFLGEGGRVAAVETADGRVFAADLALVCIGVVPHDGLAAEAGLAVRDGVVVDSALLTEDPAISAIGDCARFPHAALGMVRLESVQNAVDQARSVAARLAGRAAPYAALPWFWSDQGGLKLQIAGLAMPHDAVAMRGDPARAFSVFCYRGGLLAGVESVNRPLDHVLARRILAADGTVTPEQAADPGFDLKAHAARGAS